MNAQHRGHDFYSHSLVKGETFFSYGARGFVTRRTTGHSAFIKGWYAHRGPDGEEGVFGPFDTQVQAVEVLAETAARHGKPSDDLKALLDAASWVVRLHGTQDPRGLAELREEVANLRHALTKVRGEFPSYVPPQIVAED